MKDAETVLNEMKREVARLEEEENKLQKEVVDVKHELEKFENIMKTNQQKIKHWKKEVCID
jgi:predicted  nucleic acid-binding Zn-ribbon protein